MSQPLVSVVLPTYKRAHLLAQAMQSVLAQTHANLELIVVDDNSPDDTAAVVASFHDARIQYVKNVPNLKLPRALNRGFAMARGDYLTWTSDDNLLAPTAIEKMVGVMNQGNCDFVYADYWLFSEQDADGQPHAPQHERLPDRLQLEQGNHIGACFLYTRKLYETVGDYDPELFLVEDYDYFLRAARQFRFCHLAEPLYYFRRDDATLYISRFPEVKASDMLVRFKNGVLDAEGSAAMLAGLLMQHPRELADRQLCLALALRTRVSHRLGDWLVQRRRAHLTRALATQIAPLYAQYQAGRASFGDTRAALLACVKQHGTLAYKAPGT